MHKKATISDIPYHLITRRSLNAFKLKKHQISQGSKKFKTQISGQCFVNPIVVNGEIKYQSQMGYKAVTKQTNKEFQEISTEKFKKYLKNINQKSKDNLMKQQIKRQETIKNNRLMLTARKQKFANQIKQYKKNSAKSIRSYYQQYQNQNLKEKEKKAREDNYHKLDRICIKYANHKKEVICTNNLDHVRWCENKILYLHSSRNYKHNL